MTNYQTAKQFNEIYESFKNGNWSQAAGECVEYGFWANDLLTAYDNAFDGEYDPETLRDLVLLAEMAAEKRYKK